MTIAFTDMSSLTAREKAYLQDLARNEEETSRGMTGNCTNSRDSNVEDDGRKRAGATPAYANAREHETSKAVKLAAGVVFEGESDDEDDGEQETRSRGLGKVAKKAKKKTKKAAKKATKTVKKNVVDPIGNTIRKAYESTNRAFTSRGWKVL